jgi:hypothetical protein
MTLASSLCADNTYVYEGSFMDQSDENIEFNRYNDDGHRERAAQVLEHLVTDNYVCSIYGFRIEEVDERIGSKTMVGFDLGILGSWLPEWQFVRDEQGKAEVSPLALEVWRAWGDFKQDHFVKVMATHSMSNVPVIGESSTYGEMVQLGLNPLLDPNARSYFRDLGVSHG